MVRRRFSDFTGTPPGTPTPGTHAPAPVPAPAGDPANAPGRALVPTQPPVTPQAPAAVPLDTTAALSAELNGLHDILGEVAVIVANLSGRVDDQTVALNKLTGTAAETRQAAFAARSQTDPTLFAREVSDSVLPTIRELTTAVTQLSHIATDHHGALNKAEGQVLDARRDLRNARAELVRWKAYLPGVVGGSLILALLLGFFVVIPVLSRYRALCDLGGGLWSWNEAGATACVFRTSP